MNSVIPAWLRPVAKPPTVACAVDKQQAAARAASRAAKHFIALRD